MKDVKFLSIAKNMAARSSLTKDLVSDFNKIEERWQKTLESGDAIAVKDLREDLNNDTGSATRVVLLNMSKTLNEVGGYISEMFAEPKDLKSVVQGIFNEATKLREIPYYKYDTTEMDKIVDNMKENSTAITSGILNMINLIESSAKDNTATSDAVKEMAVKAKEFINLVKTNPLFAAKSIVPKQLDTDFIHMGNAAIKQNADINRYRDFCKTVQAIPEKLYILANKFNKPDFNPKFYEMSENCRYLHRMIIFAIEGITAKSVAMAYNLNCIKKTMEDNFVSLNDALSANI